jgi:hypothetical protein
MLFALSLSVAISPESWTPFTVSYSNNDDGRVVRAKDKVEGKSSKHRPTQTGFENLKDIGRSGYEFD